MISMAGPIFDPGRSPGMKRYRGEEERKGKKEEEEEKKRRKKSQCIKETNLTTFSLTSPNKKGVPPHVIDTPYLGL